MPNKYTGNISPGISASWIEEDCPLFSSLPKEVQEEMNKELERLIREEIDREFINEIKHKSTEVEKFPIDGEPMDGDQAQQLQDDLDYWKERLRKNNLT